ncbi:hypothetical protein [Clostridium sp.]|uniref:hypothetical protein n=1 Tax=Clostridium sp. TaxID=1506 RepID=UPI0026248AB6|nr:hypothetical protein [Clostridium sp.]
MNTNQIITTFISVTLIIYAIFRQLSERRVKILNFIIFPIFAAYESYQLFPGFIIPFNQIIELLLIILIGLLAGAIQAHYTKVYYKGNQLYMRGSKETLIAWIAMIFFRYIVRALFQGSNSFTSFKSTGWILFAGVAVVFTFKSIILFLKHEEVRQFFEERLINGRSKIRS